MSQNGHPPGSRASLEERLRTLSPAKRALLERALAERERAAQPAAAAIPRRPDPARAPASFAQELLWYLDLANPELTAYNVPRVFRVEGEIDAVALERAINALVDRHEILRTTYSGEDSAPEQRIAPDVRVWLERADLRSLAPAEREAEAKRLVGAISRRKFVLGSDHPLRALLIQTGDTIHVLALVTHHIASDGWSGGVMFRELSRLYERELGLTAEPLPPLPIQYGDYATWQREHLSGEWLSTLLAFWRNHLDGAPAVLDLPADFPRPAQPSFDGAVEVITLPEALSRRVQELAQRHDATLFMVLLAAFQTLLHRYSGQDDVVVGTPVAGRDNPQVEPLIGFFVNMLAFRGSMGDDPTFLEHLRRTREACLGGFEHQELPFGRLVMELAKGRSLSHSPVYQVVFALQNQDAAELRLGEAKLSAFTRDGTTTKQDLGLFAWEVEGRLRVAAEYRTDLFQPGTIRRLLAHFEVLLDGAATAPSARLSALPLLPGKERQQVVHEWNRTDAPYPREQTLHALIEAQVARTPDAVALVTDGGTMTYAELNQRANQLAGYLRGLGAGPGRLVGLSAERSFDLMVGLLGILKSGAAYVPLDPEYPAERLEYMLGDSGAKIVVGQRQTIDRLPPGAFRPVYLDAESELLAGESKDNPGALAGPEDLAYVIYTSGSTGRPKAAMLPHRSVVNYLWWMKTAFPLGGDDGVLQKAPVSFDASVWELYLPLLTGSRLILARPGGHQDLSYLIECIARHGVTTIQFVPSLLGVLLDVPEFVAACASVRLVFCGGEALPADVAQRARARLGAELHNLYGPTETTVYSTAWPVPGGFDAAVAPIGRPIANTQVYVVDRRSEPTPIGVPGELLIGGDGVGRGYLGRPELTAEKYLADPFRDGPGRRVYRTGDLARWRADGQLEFLGRIDHQVKIRGFRIELGEVEAAIATHPNVAQAAVLVREDEPGHRHLVGYFVAQTEPAPAAVELREFLHGTLPDYMIPAAFVALAAFPLNPSGKLDRKALPPPVQRAGEQAALYVAPQTVFEHQLVMIWERLLGRQPIGIRHDFFDLGGHSLLAAQMAHEVERSTGVKLPLAALFETATIQGLASLLEKNAGDPVDLPVIEVQAGGKRRPFFMVHGDIVGGGFYCRGLAHEMGPAYPIYAFPPHGPSPDPTAWSIEAMAAANVAEVRRIQPAGPYRLGGYCIGGLIAYQMARQLLREGQEVELLLVLDTVPINAAFPWVEPLVRAVSNLSSGDRAARFDRRAYLVRRLRQVSRMRPLERVMYMAGFPFRFLMRRVRRRLRRAAPGGGTPGMPHSPARPRNQLLSHNLRAALAYFPGRYDGPLTVVLARAGRRDGSDPTSGWKRIAPRVASSRITATHVGMVTTHLPGILREQLSRLDDGSGS